MNQKQYMPSEKIPLAIQTILELTRHVIEGHATGPTGASWMVHCAPRRIDRSSPVTWCGRFRVFTKLSDFSAADLERAAG